MVSLSLKDRSAILPGGFSPDVCYWLDGSSGNFVTSTYYRGWLHPWVARFDRGRCCDQWWGKEWTALKLCPDQVLHSTRPEYFSGESTDLPLGRPFQHPLAGGRDGPARRIIRPWAILPTATSFSSISSSKQSRRNVWARIRPLICSA